MNYNYVLKYTYIHLFNFTFSGKLMPLGSNDDYNEENVFDANSSSGFFSSSRSSPRSQSGGSGFDPTGSERFSRKVFVGGLPPDIGNKTHLPLKNRTSSTLNTNWLLFLEFFP